MKQEEKKAMSRATRRIVYFFLFAGVISLSPGSASADSVFESYETGFGAWTPNADTPLSWSVTRSQDQAQDGVWSLDFTADGTADDGTVWVVRPVQLSAGTWDVTLDFQMWSPSEGLFGTWEVVAFIGLPNPTVEEDFTMVGSTHMVAGWQPYSHSQTLVVGGPTTAYVAYGFNIVFEVHRTLFIDSATISGIPLTCEDPACDSDGVCEAGEDCLNCPCDCASASGATCGNGVCEAGDGENCVSCAADCDGKQNGNPNNRFCCGDGEGDGAIVCDSTTPECNGGGFSCTDVPAAGSCCGDGTCEGAENESNCAIDCVVICSVPADCNDGVGCTDDDCVGGLCVNSPNNANCPDDGAFCNGSEFCDAIADCASTGDPCSGSETCNETTDTCDQPPCQPKGGPCTTNADCCSVNCKPNGTCR